ncbi:uncharacterized protein PHACADRAFT_258472 [Phanerochaete carnosa HHB-10118-sp]|uniref:General stress protein FMN-binding split barrel domain-containing protein n=1 Tax=Phanerochaete carnosa (strain HHB-10118-sp) TaxID=650164 RepID=K5VSR2_PHACS|nr:uncharacterized protein PHACADRAFT_258472 [Phanerochaete carnosa HHB-10118-sp]EKM54548.1 hypothetical protein PHACADRAFT_258472 [Phanerochaete carnosa HHB-10118-sp]
MSYNKELDPYSAKAQNDNLTPQEKIDGLHSIVKKVKTGMLTTRSADGLMHSRAMSPASPNEPNQVNLIFIANRASHKFDEIENDSHANVSFYDDKSTHWASYSGIAKISQEKELIARHWSSTTSAWFGDLGDGIHKGDQNDPRVAVIEVIPEEVRYWLSTANAVTKAADIVASAAIGKVSAPGELRTITKQEIQLIQGLHHK